MAVRSYRVCKELRGVYADAQKGILTIPAGATLTLVEPSEQEPLIRVLWNDINVRVFNLDFRERTIPLLR